MYGEDPEVIQELYNDGYTLEELEEMIYRAGLYLQQPQHLYTVVRRAGRAGGIPGNAAAASTGKGTGRP